VLPDGFGTQWERMFRFVFTNSTNPMFMLDEQRIVSEINEAGLQLIDRSRDEVIGSPAQTFVPLWDRAEGEKRWKAILQKEAGEFHGAGALVLGDGSEREYEFAARMVGVGGRRFALYVLLTEIAAEPALIDGADFGGALTHGEREVVTMLAMGKVMPEIAEELQISPEEVRAYVRTAMEKTGTRTHAHLVARALGEEDLIHLPELPS
jgi:PAS domain S-box-containing protein